MHIIYGLQRFGGRDASYDPPQDEKCIFYFSDDIIDQLAEALSGDGVLTESGEQNSDGEDRTVLQGYLDLEAIGLTKDDLRRLVLASYVTQATVGTELGIEISYEELENELTDSEMQQLLANNQTDPDAAGYYYIRILNEDTGEYMYYTATRGSVRIENENGELVTCVNNATFDYYIDWFNGNKGPVRQESAEETVTKLYTVREIGTIEMITFTSSNDGSCNFSSTTINYASNSEIQQCMVQIELLIDFLQISASPDFLEAFEKLVINQEITLRVYEISTVEEIRSIRSYTMDILADARKTLSFRGKKVLSDGRIDEHVVTDYRDFTYDLGQYIYRKHTTDRTITTNYEIKLISADSWYFKADRTVTKDSWTTYEYYNQNGESTTFTPESSFNPMDSVPEYSVPGFSISGVTSFDELQNRIVQEIGGDGVDLGQKRDMLNSRLQDRSDVQDMIDYYTDNDGYAAESGMSYRDYVLETYDTEILNLSATAASGTEKKMKSTTQDMLITGTMDYEDNTDAFLGLWKNDSGRYEEGATFNPDGERVAYKDLYEQDKETAYVGDLFENADEMLFDILDYAENSTQAYVPVMKYILYRYTGNDYGITTFEDLMRLIGFETRDLSNFPGDSVQEKVWWALINAGYSKIAAAAVLGNIECESGFDPARIEDGSGNGLGLCQWSFGRRTQLEGYIASKGTDTTDINTQIEFLLGELTPGGGADGYASYQLGGSSSSAYDGNSYTASDWENATDLNTATTAFMALFERPSYDPSKHHLSDRQDAAQRYYNQFKDMEQPTADSRIGQINLTGDDAIKMAAMLTEALRIADDDRYYYSQEDRYGEWSYDCSSFAYRLYKEYFGITLGTWTGDTAGYTAMAVYESTDMSESNLEPGDVLWRSGHVAIYIGNGQYVHASSPENGIMVSTYTQGYFTKLYRYVE